MFSIYALYNKDHNKLYIGQTKDIDARLNLHNTHEFENSYTARYSGKWEVIYKEEAADRQTALKREKQLKSYRGRMFVKKHIPV
jgi:putative endonuclease